MKEVLVIGDSCVDVFQYGICTRLSPEAPVPIFKSTNLTTNGGMAINVGENIRGLNCNCDVVTNNNRPCKTRYIDESSNQMLLRVDGKDNIERIEDWVLKGIKYDEYDAIIISDYNKGFLTKEIIQDISTKHPLVFMDTKKELSLWAENVKFIKLNEKEFNENVGREFKDRYKHNLIVTKGSYGATWMYGDGLNNAHEFPIEDSHPVRDLTGAGDTFIASLVVKYLETKDTAESIRFANKCSAWVVTQKGVASINLKEI